MASYRGKIPALTRNQLIKDLEQDKPNPSKWDKWIAVKSMEYGVEEEDVRKYLTLQLEMLDYHVSIATAPVAQKIAAALGATRMKAISVLEQGMDATKIRAVKIINPDEDGPQFEEITEPDWRERRGCAVEVLKIWGAFAPQVIHVEHDILNELANLSEDELLARRQKLIMESSPTDVTYSVIEESGDAA